MISPDSLAETLDSFWEVDFHGLTVAPDLRREAADWLVARCAAPRSYAGLPAPTARDYETGARVFTGEEITTGAGTGHILGEEACRVLRQLDVGSKAVESAVATGRANILARIRLGEERGSTPGLFCCGTCTSALWRNISTGGFPDGERLIEGGLAALREHRDGKGRWRRFPFHYTLLALLDLDHPAVAAELRYTAGSCERSIKASGAFKGNAACASRRRAVLTRVLERC